MDIRTTVDTGTWTTGKIVFAILIGLLIVASPLVLQGFQTLSFFVRILAVIGIYVMLALGLNIVVGYAGLLDLGYVAFYAMGAYAAVVVGDLFVKFVAANATGDMATFWTASTWIMMLPVAAIVAAMTGIALGTPVLRLRGDYLAIVTLGFGEIIRILATNDFLGLTNGAKGLPRVGQSIPNPIGLTWMQDNLRFNIDAINFKFMFSVNLYWYYAVVLLCILTIFIVRRLDNSRLGRSWVAMREDEVAASSVGVNIMTAKLWAFSLGAVWGGLAGVVFANSQGFVSPESFTFMESVFIVSMVVLGGMGSIPGVIVGACLIAGIPELIRGLAQSPMFSSVIPAETASAIANYRYLVFGLLMVIMMAFRPQGIIPSQRRALELHPDDSKILHDEDQSMWDIEQGDKRSEHDL
ncbi:MAG: ABC transporter ATP-binding protein [Coriobacteriia bacterium]|nr:ABC transporter ATP-binding protein [Coriobacteriia bacterium]